MPKKKKTQRCEYSGEVFSASWLPDDKGYPGAAVCACSMGVPFKKGTCKEAEDGYFYGIIRTHNKPED